MKKRFSPWKIIERRLRNVGNSINSLVAFSGDPRYGTAIGYRLKISRFQWVKIRADTEQALE